MISYSFVLCQLLKVSLPMGPIATDIEYEFKNLNRLTADKP